MSLKNDLQFEEMYLLTYAPSEKSNQPGHLLSLISFPFPFEGILHPYLLKMKMKILIRLQEYEGCTWSKS